MRGESQLGRIGPTVPALCAADSGHGRRKLDLQRQYVPRRRHVAPKLAGLWRALRALAAPVSLIGGIGTTSHCVYRKRAVSGIEEVLGIPVLEERVVEHLKTRQHRRGWLAVLLDESAKVYDRIE